jgi:hypothetical protein
LTINALVHHHALRIASVISSFVRFAFDDKTTLMIRSNQILVSRTKEKIVIWPPWLLASIAGLDKIMAVLSYRFLPHDCRKALESRKKERVDICTPVAAVFLFFVLSFLEGGGF